MEISIVAANANGALITGAAASTALKIRRVADGYLLDWDDLTFKASGWGHNSTALLEVDATNLPGEYKKVVVITAWTDGFYQALVHYDDATTVLNFSGEQYIQGGREVDMNLDAAVSGRMATFTYTAPDSAATIATAVWNYLTASMTTAASIGKKLADWVVGTIDTYTGNTKQTGDVGVAGAGLTALGDTRLANLDAAVSTRTKPADTQAAVTTVATLTNAPPDSAGITTLLTRLAAALTITGGKVDVNDKSGFTISGTKTTLDALHDLATSDILAQVEAALTAQGYTTARAPYLDELAAVNLPADVDTLLTRIAGAVLLASAYTAPDNTDIASILNAINDAGHGLAALLTAINSRLAASSYAAPDNADIAAIKGDVEHVTYGLNALLTAINSRLAASGYTAPDNTNIGLIKAKTDNLPAVPASQGDAQAVPAAVWTVGTRTLTSFGTLVSDIATAVWAAVTRTLTAGAGISAADVWGYVTRTLTAGTKDSQIDAIKTVTDALETHVGNALETFDPPTRTEATSDKVAIIAAINSAELGPGAISWTYTLTNSEDGEPIADADVWVTTDLAGTNVIASGKTDQYGNVTFFLDAGTVYVFRQKSGWDFVNPDAEVVS